MEQTRGGELAQVFLVLATRVPGLPRLSLNLRLVDGSVALVEVCVSERGRVVRPHGVPSPQLSQEAHDLTQL